MHQITRLDPEIFALAHDLNTSREQAPLTAIELLGHAEDAEDDGFFLAAAYFYEKLFYLTTSIVEREWWTMKMAECERQHLEGEK